MEVVNVLIVDDEPGMRLGAARVLKRNTVAMPALDLNIRFHCDTAEDGRSAIEKLKEKHFDLVLLDYKLPDINGLDVLNQIKSIDHDVMTIMMTAYASLDVAVTATKNGTFDFLAKPFSSDELESVVAKAARSLLATKQARKLAAEKRRVRFEFISVLAHELKSPLSAVESYLELMRAHDEDERISVYDTALDRAIIRLQGMRRLIFDLLDLTRIESGEKVRQIASIDPIQAMSNCIENVREMADKRNVAIHFDASEPIGFKGDMGELEIICSNLLSNAVKYNKDGGYVHASVSMVNGSLAICVEDEGIGISEVDQECLFKSFSRIRNKETEFIEGSGLGLSILKRLVDIYHGDISVVSAPGQGSTFTVTLKSVS